MRYHKIPDETIHRLPAYLRELVFLSEQGQQSISSRVLADYLGANPWQIRKDFSYFASFGTPGVGYNIKKLIKQIDRILKLDVGHKAALVGVDNLGLAVLTHSGFKIYGLDIVAAFDIDTKKIGQKIKDITIEDVTNLHTLRKRRINLGFSQVVRHDLVKGIFEKKDLSIEEKE